MSVFTFFGRFFRAIFAAFGTFFSMNRFFLWDIGLNIVNLFTRKKKAGYVVAEGKPGYGGIWPEYIPPREGDSRCACPGLNALANHGLLPRDGKNIQFKHMGDVVYDVFNFAPSFSQFVVWNAAQFLGRDYKKGTLNLNDLDVHNAIEHDASICRLDAKWQPDQSKPPAMDIIHDFLASATGENGEAITPADLSRFLEKRRAHSQAHNPQYTLNFSQRFFGSGNASLLVLAFGGKVNKLRTFLNEERLPEGWQSTVRSKRGLTLVTFNRMVTKVEFGIDERRGAKVEAKAKAIASASAGESNGKSALDVPEVAVTAAV